MLGPKVIDKIINNHDRCTYKVSRDAQLNSFFRFADSVMKKHDTIPGVYHPHMEPTDYINKNLSDKPYFKGVKMDDLLKWFEKNDDPRFPLITSASFTPNIISYNNGFLNLTTLQFTLWSKVKTPPINNHYFEADCDPASWAPSPPQNRRCRSGFRPS